MPHWHVTLPPSSFCKFSSNKDDPNHCFLHPLQRGAQLLIFCIISNIDETIDKGLAKPLEVVEYEAIFVEVEALEVVSRCRNFLKIAMVVFEFISSFP